MKKLNNLKWLLLGLSFWSLISCSPSPPDVFAFEYLTQRLTIDPVTGHQVLSPSPTCMNRIDEPECLHGIAIVSGKEIYVGDLAPHLYNGKTATALRAESVYLPAVESYAPLAAYIIDACKKMNCSKKIAKSMVKLNTLNGAESEVDDLLGTP